MVERLKQPSIASPGVASRGGQWLGNRGLEEVLDRLQIRWMTAALDFCRKVDATQ